MEYRKPMTQIRTQRMNRAVCTGVTAIWALVVVFAFQCALASGETATTGVKNSRILIAIDGMSCTSCANGIKAMLKRTPGVISAEVSYERREANVEYDPSRTSPEKIIEAITNMGYKAKVKEQVDG